MSYAEAFLEPSESSSAKKYSKDLKRQFKHVFIRLIDLYQKGVQLYTQLSQSKLNHAANNSGLHRSNTLATNDKSSNKTSLPPAVALASANSPNTRNQTTTPTVDMQTLLAIKFNELENNFRNLLLVDGVRQLELIIRVCKLI